MIKFIINELFFPSHSSLVATVYRAACNETTIAEGIFISSIAIVFRNAYIAKLYIYLIALKVIE